MDRFSALKAFTRVVEAGSFTLADAKVLSLFKPGIPTLLIANKLDAVGRRHEIAP